MSIVIKFRLFQFAKLQGIPKMNSLLCSTYFFFASFIRTIIEPFSSSLRSETLSQLLSILPGLAKSGPLAIVSAQFPFQRRQSFSTKILNTEHVFRRTYILYATHILNLFHVFSFSGHISIFVELSQVHFFVGNVQKCQINFQIKIHTILSSMCI